MELVLISLLAILVVPLVLFTTGILRIVLGLLFLLFFPGYVLIAVLFPRKGSLGTIERLALSLGLSIAIVSLIGLVLNYTSWGIRLHPIVVSTVCFVLIASLTALYRRQRLPQEERLETRIRIRRPNWSQWSKMDRALTIVSILSLVAAMGALVYIVATPRVGERFTQFYVLGSQGTAEDYPQKLVVGQQGEVTLGIVNQEHEDASYRIEVSIDGEKVQEIGPISLAHEEKWEEEVTFVPTKPTKPEGGKVRFQLYKGDGSEPCLDLSLGIKVGEAA